MEEIIIPAAYFVLFCGCMIKGGAVLVAAIFAAELGYIELPVILAVAAVATVTSDHLFYYIGRKNSSEVLWRRPELIPFAEKLYEKLKQKPLRVFISHQFLNGFTQKVPYLAGTSNLSPTNFMRYSLIASFLWIMTLSVIAIGLHWVLEGYVGETQYYEFSLLLGILVTGLLIQLIIHVKREKIAAK